MAKPTPKPTPLPHRLASAAILAGPLLSGLAAHPIWVILAVAAFAALPRASAPGAGAMRSLSALGGLLFNQAIIVNVVYLAGYGLVYMTGGRGLALPIWAPLALSAAATVVALVLARMAARAPEGEGEGEGEGGDA